MIIEGYPAVPTTVPPEPHPRDGGAVGAWATSRAAVRTPAPRAGRAAKKLASVLSSSSGATGSPPFAIADTDCSQTSFSMKPSVSRLLPLLLPAALLAALMGPASAGASAPAVLVTDSRMTRMVALMDRGASCMPSSDRAYIRRVVLEAPSHMVREMSDAGMDSLMEVCKQHRRGSPGGIIFPGTKWCGTGNIAVGYHDLGEKEAEDSCCREHDNCPSQLGPGECRGGLCNNTPFTTSHCDCDARFRRCLQTVNTDTAHTLGTLFFNVGQVKCFKEQRLCPDTDESSKAKRVRQASAKNEDPAAPPCPTPELQFRPSGRYSPLPPLF